LWKTGSALPRGRDLERDFRKRPAGAGVADREASVVDGDDDVHVVRVDGARPFESSGLDLEE